MAKFLRSTAIALALGFFLPVPGPETIFVYQSAYAADPSVPSWIEKSCCGPSDVHHLRPDQVHRTDDYYTVDGYWANGGKINDRIARPSQDGEYWIFYADYGDKGQSGVYCFFVPMDF